MIGQLVGHYKVVRKIGDGGMGSVYEAVHESIGRRVAIKVLKTEYSKEPNLVARFFNEARAVNIVTHPGIVGSFDYGQLGDGTAYIVMEFIDGESLSARIKRTRSGLGSHALRLGRQIAAALAAAHSKGIIHRDLKPDNIMIAADPEAPGGERAKVLDFGIAKIVSEHDASKLGTGLTQAGAVMGTPRYMSPEQCRGSGKVDFKTDVYALGVIMFEMLTGRLPFTPEGTGALMAMHMFQPPPPLREIDPGISPVTDQIVQNMLAKDPAARPTMAEIAASIEQLGVKATGVMAVISPQAASHSGLRPVLGESSGPTTSSRPSLITAGQTADPTKVNLGGRSGRRLLVPLLTAALLSSAGLAVILRRPTPTPAPTTASSAAPSRKVVWQIKSSPPGVEIVRIADGEVLGLTPWRSEQLAGPGKFGVTLRRSGFIDRQLLVQRDSDCDELVELDPMPAAQAPATTKDRPGKKSPKNSKPSKKPVTADDTSFDPMH